MRSIIRPIKILSSLAKLEQSKYKLPLNDLNYPIRNDEIGIPEIQRPFVWEPNQVKGLIDSLYNGYPIGYIVTWKDPAVTLKDGEKK